MTPTVQILLILSCTLIAVCALNTLDNIFGKNNKDKGDNNNGI